MAVLDNCRLICIRTSGFVAILSGPTKIYNCEFTNLYGTGTLFLTLPEFDEHNRKNWTIENCNFNFTRDEPRKFGSVDVSSDNLLGSDFYESLRKLNTETVFDDDDCDY